MESSNRPASACVGGGRHLLFMEEPRPPSSEQEEPNYKVRAEKRGFIC